jgi:Bacterial Ig-like domain (group 2).
MKIFNRIGVAILSAGLIAGASVALALPEASSKVQRVDATGTTLVASYDFASNVTNKSNTTSTLLTTTTLQTLLNKACATPAATVSSLTSVYDGKGSGGTGIPQAVLKVGLASAAGSFTFSIGGAQNVNQVVIVGYPWKATSSLSINESAGQTGTALAQKTYTFDVSDTQQIAVNVTASAVCVSSLTLNYVSNPKVIITDVPSSLKAGDNGALGYTTQFATDPVVTWSSSNETVLSINASSGAYEALSYGQATITATMNCTEGTFTSTCVLTIDAGLITIAQANAIGAALASGGTSAYKVTLEGYLTSLNADAQAAGSERALTLSTFVVGGSGDSIVIFGVYSNNAMRGYLLLNGTARFTGFVTNYAGTTIEITSFVLDHYTDSAIEFATEANVTLDPLCASMNVNEETWTNLANGYSSIDSYAMTALKNNASSNPECLEFVSRYDLIVAKYGFSNFMTRASAANVVSGINTQYTDDIVSTIVVTVFGALAILGYVLYSKKRKALSE